MLCFVWCGLLERTNNMTPLLLSLAVLVAAPEQTISFSAASIRPSAESGVRLYGPYVAFDKGANIGYISLDNVPIGSRIKRIDVLAKSQEGNQKLRVSLDQVALGDEMDYYKPLHSHLTLFHTVQATPYYETILTDVVVQDGNLYWIGIFTPPFNDFPILIGHVKVTYEMPDFEGDPWVN